MYNLRPWVRSAVLHFGSVAVLIAVIIALSACSILRTVGTLTSVATSSAPISGVSGVDEKAMYAAEATYNVAAKVYLEANRANVLSPSIKSIAKEYLTRAYQYLLAARAAYKLGNATTFNERISDLNAATSQIKTLLGK